MANERRPIDREALRKAIFAEEWEQSAKMQITLDYIDMLINDQPTVDAVEVCRCKDCHHMTIEQGLRYCNAWEMFNGAGDDGFCNYWERRCG